jgi:hypothetical protein
LFMTAAKPLQRKEVDKVAAALLGALRPEYEGQGDHIFEYPPALRQPTSKRGKVLWAAYLRAWAASARFSRREQKGLARKRGLGAAFFDDDQTDLAIASLERARWFVKNAREALQLDMARISKERARRGLPGDDFGKHPLHVQAIERLEKAIGVRAAKIQTFEDIPQARTRKEWDAFLSETAKDLLAAGFGTREVAGLLTGERPEAVDRATLERFRQRVSRLEISRG